MDQASAGIWTAQADSQTGQPKSDRLLVLGGTLELPGFNVAQRQEAAMSLQAAIDLHSSNSVLAVMDGDGNQAEKGRR